MKQKQIWIVIVSDKDKVIFKRACQSKQKAENAVVDYLHSYRDFKGKSFTEACFWIKEKKLRFDLKIFQMQPEEFTEVLPLIAPPPYEKGLFRVVYVIDVGAGNVIEAAMNAYEMMSDSDSLPPILEVIDNKGNKIKIDLSQRKKKGK
jgi:hypothetical protein